jgi:membrane associated rhomboid family serine protease
MSCDRKLLTWALIATCSLIFILTEYGWMLALGESQWLKVSQYCLNPSSFKPFHLWSFGLIHLSPLHLLFNMMSLYQLSPEPSIGSLAFSTLVTNLLYIGAAVHISVSYILQYTLGVDMFMFQCTAGLSGGKIAY